MFPGLQQFPEGQIIAFALIFLRIIAFVVTWPVFGTSSVPVQVKVLFSLMLAIIVFPTVSFDKVDLIKIDNILIFLSIREIVVGLVLGFLMRMIFFAISISGELISLGLGLSSAQVFNPAIGSHGNVIDQFQTMIATLFFLAINGHHVFIGGMAESFRLAPVAAIGLNTEVFSGIVPIMHQICITGLKIAAPILAAIFLTNVAMGILGRAVPQINVLVTSMPITFLMGMVILIVITPYFLTEVNLVTELMADKFFQFMKVI